MRIIRAIDVGYGSIKYIKQAASNGNALKLGSFPALAPTQVSHGSQFTVGGLGKRDTHRLTINGVTYEVGRDAHMAQSRLRFGRKLDADYPTSDAHLALILGAISEMKVDHIDLLVLGLPLSTYKRHYKGLRARVIGTHELPHGEAVKISEVIVVPQPLGGFYDYALSNGKLKAISGKNHLTIDPGFNTLDWLVTQDEVIDDRRSGAAMSGGMVRILSDLQRIISEEVGDSIGDMTRLDQALYKGEPLRVSGEDIDLKKYSHVVKAAARESIDQMAYQIGGETDIDNIIIVGGGAMFFSDALREKFKKHQIYIGSSPVFANVRGFQLIGEERAGV
jgi:plasmid segregation protein ParM